MQTQQKQKHVCIIKDKKLHISAMAKVLLQYINGKFLIFIFQSIIRFIHDHI